MKFDIIHVGSFKEKYLSAAFDEYKKRISASGELRDIEIKESRLSDDPSENEIKKALDSEASLILEKLDPRSKKIALCVEGMMVSSEELAALFESASGGGYSKISFVIGSSHGLSETVKRECDLRLSFSRMTFPHQLMRVILAEQIYRAQTILSGKKYHK